MPNEFEKPNRLDEVEKKLNSPTQQMGLKNRKPLREEEYSTPQSWPAPITSRPEPVLSADYKKPNWFVRFFILAFIFFLTALGFVGYKFIFDNGIDASNVDILINAPLTIGAGEILDFEVVMQNKNQLGMRYVDVEVFYPEGTRSVEDINIKYPTTKETIETIEVGGIVKKNYSALLFGEEGDKKEMSVLLTYQVEGSTTLFKKEKKFDVVLKSTPVRLTITNVKELTSGQELEFNVELVSNSTQPLKNVLVQAVYPFGFTYKSSNLAVEEDKRSWIIPSLDPKESTTFKIKGTLEGQNNDEKFFKFSTGLKNEEASASEVVFSTKNTTVTLTRPFFELDLAINKDNSNPINVELDQAQNITVSYKNNTSFPLRNATISLVMSGAVLNEESIQVSEGFYQSINNTLTWDSSTSDRLAYIPVGASGSFTFALNGLGLMKNALIQNPELSMTIQVKGNRNPEDQVPQIIENSIVRKIKFNTQFTTQTHSEFYTSTFANSGPIPPKAEQKTSYTTVVELFNTSNTVSNGRVTMHIPNFVQYENAFSPSSENVTYDSVTRTLSWNVGDIPAKTGYAGIAPKKLSVQVSIIPSISQAGTSPSLLDNIKFTGTDTFTNEQIIREADTIQTSIVDSKGYYDSSVSR